VQIKTICGGMVGVLPKELATYLFPSLSSLSKLQR
jgi:hypothetical protein